MDESNLCTGAKSGHITDLEESTVLFKTRNKKDAAYIQLLQSLFKEKVIGSSFLCGIAWPCVRGKYKECKDIEPTKLCRTEWDEMVQISQFEVVVTPYIKDNKVIGEKGNKII